MKNFQEHSNFIFKIADRRLRNLFKPHEYGKIILPFIVFKRLDSIISDKKDEIIILYKKWKSKTDDYNEIILNKLKIKFFNTSSYDLEKLTQDPQNIKANFKNYLKGFSDNVSEIIENFDIDKEINKLEKNNRLFTLIEEFSEIDFSPQKVSNFEMGLIFEELLRRFSELSNETSGEHYTPRDVVRLLVSLVLTESFEKLKSTSVTSIFDCCCGTGGMLSVSKEWINEKFDKKIKVFLFGQEFNPETYAVCKSDMLITDDDPENIKQGNSLDNDKFQKNKFQYMITNPPYGDDWNSSKKFIHDELNKKNNRFVGGIPRVSDGQLLFLQHLISKMDQEGSRIGIVFNGSPMYTADANGGESNIRKWIIENDLLETIVSLPDKLFFNTGIPTFFWILDNNKSKKRKNKIQLINATEIYTELKKNLNEKNKEISEIDQKKILKTYVNFRESEISKIKNNSYFGYTKICVETPKKNLTEKEKKSDKIIADIKLRNFERVPLDEDIEEFFKNEIKPFAPDSYIDRKKDAIGYEINFKKIFYKYKKSKNSKEILEELNKLEVETSNLNKILKKTINE